MTTDVLPHDLAQEVLCQYADVLRVGSLTLNGVRVSWDTSSSNSGQLESFNSKFLTALRRVPGLSCASVVDFCQVSHWFCKAVSINYALSEVLMLLQERLGERFGAVCSVRTCASDGTQLVSYSVIVGCTTMRVQVRWTGKGNIICCYPKTGQSKVKGTLSHVETEFPLAPEADFRPTYRIHMKLRRSRTRRLLSKVTRPFIGPGRCPPVEEVSPEAPLRSSSCSTPPGDDKSFDSPGLSGSASTTSSNLSVEPTVAFSEDSDFEEHDLLFPAPLTLEPHSVRKQLFTPACSEQAGVKESSVSEPRPTLLSL